MLGIHDLGLFILSGILFNLAPGPDVIYVMSRGASHGARVGLIAALGISAGCFVHILAAAIGLSAMLAASASAFTVIKLIGAAYLIYSGLVMIAARKKTTGEETASPVSILANRNVFVQGFFTNALNPKVALFFLAFLPQFIDKGATDKAWAFACLGLILNLTGTGCNMILAGLAARLAAGFCRAARLRMAFSKGVGGLFILLGIKLALADNS